MEITSVIKYEGDNTTFVWKHPKEDFNTLSQLIVHESQEVVLFQDGQALDVFTAGRHTLETANIPLLKKIRNIPTDGVSPFHCEVYFINKVEQMGIKWGTDSTVQYMEPTYGFPISIGANGEMAIRVNDSKKLLLKLVGTEKEFTQESLSRVFKSFLMTKVKSYIAQSMRTGSINIFEIDEHLEDFSASLKSRLGSDFDEYGVSLEKFFVSSIMKPDGDKQYEEHKRIFFQKYADIEKAKIQQQVGIIEQETETKRLVMEAEGIAKKRNIEGYTYQQERGFDVAEKAAVNEGTGNFSSAGIGLGMMTGVGGAVGNTVGGIVSGAINGVNAVGAVGNRFCENCGAILHEDSQFCEECGTAIISDNRCSNCGYVFQRKGNFCPKCGTKRGSQL